MTGLRLSVTAALLLAPAAHAGRLDDALLEHAPKLVEKLWRHDVRAAAVLPFSFQGGYNAAPVCTALVPRVENALTLVQDPRLKTPLRVARVGAAGRRGWSADREAFDRLFATEAEAVWGDKVKPDGLLTGTVVPSADRRSVRVTFSLLRPGAWKAGKPAAVELTSLDVPADAALVRELGQNVASRALVVKKKGGEEAKPATPDDVGGMRFEILYDGKKQDVTAEAGPEPAFTVEAPRVGQKVTMTLQRVGKEAPTLGAVVKVNGKSLFEEQDGESLACRKWLYPATKAVREDFDGFYTKAGDRLTCRPFEASEGEATRLGARAMWIDVDVFVSREAPPEPAEAELIVSTRSLARKRSATLAEARDAAAAANRLTLPALPAARPTEYDTAMKVTSRGVVLGAGKPLAATEAVTTGKLPNAARAGGVSIRMKAAGGPSKEIED